MVYARFRRFLLHILDFLEESSQVSRPPPYLKNFQNFAVFTNIFVPRKVYPEYLFVLHNRFQFLNLNLYLEELGLLNLWEKYSLCLLFQHDKQISTKKYFFKKMIVKSVP